jgi:SAM-dependent methyltransferase
MFALEPGRALREIRRVLRPGGRAAVAVWAARERNPWLGLVMDAVSAQIGAPIPPPGIPGPFALGDADELRRLLDDAGLADVRVGELSVPLRTATFDEWWGRTSALAGPLSAILASMPETAVQALRERGREAARDYETASGGLDFPGVTLIAAGRRA